MNKFIYTFILLFSFQIAFTMPNEEVNVSLANPQDAATTHLHFLQENNYNAKKAAMAICNEKLSQTESVTKAVKLKQILDGKGLYVNVNLIPNNPNYVDSASGKNIYYLSPQEPRIYLEKKDDSWCYSNYSISKVDEMYAEVYPFGTSFIHNLVPASIGDKKFLTLHVWQYLGILILIGVIAALSFLLKKILHLIIQVFAKSKLSRDLSRNERLKRVASSSSLFFVFWLASKLIPALLLPAKLSTYIIKSLNIVAIIFLAILAARLATFFLFYLEKIAERTASKLDDQLLPIVNNLIKFVIVIIAIALVLRQLNVDLMAILAGLSVGALALALAAQDTVKNFIGSITIFLDHPFEIDDYIIAGGAEGTVEEVGIRATRIRTPAQSVAYIPNGMLSNMVIDNLGLRVYRRWKHDLGIVYSTPADKIEEYVQAVEKLINEHIKTYSPNNMVFVNSLGASSINIMVSVFIDVKTYKEDLEVKHDLLLQIIRKGTELGVEFAFPTQTLYLEKEQK